MRVNMDSSINDEPRFKLLAKKLGIPFLHGVGCCWAVWLACYHARSERLRKDEANACADNDKFADVMISVGLAHEVDDDSIIVHGVTSRITFLKKQQERGSAGGKSKRKLATSKEVTTPSERLANASVDSKRSLKSETATAQANTLTPSLAPTLAPAQEKTNTNPLTPLPFSSGRFVATWTAWEQHRKEIKHPVTPTARKQQLAKLEAMGEQRAIAAIEHSIANGYQGIFEPDSKASTNGNHKTLLDRQMDHCREFIANGGEHDQG